MRVWGLGVGGWGLGGPGWGAMMGCSVEEGRGAKGGEVVRQGKKERGAME